MARDPGETFRKRLRELRDALGLTQEEFAERAGMNYKHYQEIERGGKTELRFSTLVKLADAFRLPLYQLFSEDSATEVIADAEATYRSAKRRKKS